MANKPPIRRRAAAEAPAASPTPSAPAAAPPRHATPPARPGRPPAAAPARRSSPPDAPSTPLRADEVGVPGRLSELEAIAGMGAIDMAELLGASATGGRMPSPGDKVSGVVVRLGDELQIDLGLRATGFLQRREVPDAKIGDVVEAFVLQADELGVQLSRRLSGASAGAMMQDAQEAGIPVEGLVVSRSNAGYEVRVGGVRAFCPMSQMARVPLADPDEVVGQTLTFKVIETGERVIVSRKALEAASIDEARARFWETAKEGQVVDGVVTSVQTWGAFLDLDGVDARLPKREFGWEDVADLTTRLSRGQRLKVRIVELDADTGRLTVSTRDPDLDPWKQAAHALTSGAVRQGRVVSHTDFGAFVELLPGLQGLLHVSRAGAEGLPAPGASVDVRVLSVDTAARRIELAPASFDPAAQAANKVGANVTGVVTDVEPGGVRVRLQDGRSAWLPAREVDLAPGQHLANVYRQGFELTARVLAERPNGSVTLTTRPDDGGDAWRGAMSSAPAGGMGTLGDLLRKRR